MNELIKKPISKLTKDEQEQKNLVLMFSKNVLRYAALPLYSGNVTAAFNNYLGLTPGMLARWGIPGQILWAIGKTSMAVAGISACVLDNLIPGTREERGFRD